MSSPWNSLEIAKLAIGAFTPLSVLVIGFWFNRRLKRIEHFQWANQKVIEKRLRVYEEMAPLLNDLLCYFCYVGCWKELKPSDVTQLKRRLDRIAYTNAALFPSSFLNAYNKFIGLCFETYTVWGRDALLRTRFLRRAQAAGDEWKSEWEGCFSAEEDCSDEQDVRSHYAEFLAYFAGELGVGVKVEAVETGRVPSGII